MIAGCLKTDI